MNITSRANSRYKAFHGHRPRSVNKRSLQWPSELVLIGAADCIGYQSDKLHGGGDGKLARYLHQFGKGVKLYTSANGRMLVIMGGRLNVKREGIVG